MQGPFTIGMCQPHSRCQKQVSTIIFSCDTQTNNLCIITLHSLCNCLVNQTSGFHLVALAFMTLSLEPSLNKIYFLMKNG